MHITPQCPHHLPFYMDSLPSSINHSFVHRSLSVYLPACLPVCLSICLSLSACLSDCPFGKDQGWLHMRNEVTTAASVSDRTSADIRQDNKIKRGIPHPPPSKSHPKNALCISLRTFCVISVSQMMDGQDERCSAGLLCARNFGILILFI